MPSTGSMAAQRPSAPRDSGSSYSSRQHQPAKNHPDLSGRLVYADPRSLPSFPSVGVKLDSTNTAALMAASTKSPPPIFDVSGSANLASLKAATAAAAASAALTSAKAKPAPATDVPEAAQSRKATQSSPTSSNGSRELPSPTSTSANAATTAGSTNMASKPSGTSTAGWGNSAATQAFRNSQILSAKRASAPPERPIPEIAALGHQPSLRAAKGAMKSASNPGSSSAAAASASLSNAASGSGAAAAGATGAVSSNKNTSRTRSRAQSSPLTLRQQKSLSSHYPDSTASASLTSSPPDPKVSAANALSAATIAHTKSRSGGDRSSYVGDAGAVPYTTMGRQMYTSHPSIGPEVDIQKHQEGLHASAVAMAKQMYNPRAESGGATGASVPNVQEQAYRLAQERLNKIHEQHAKDREYREHYVDPNMGASFGTGEASHRLSMRSRLRRRRSSSDSDVSQDYMRSMEIRNQMSLLNNRISEVDQDKRRRDRQNVLLAAQRNVKSQLKDIDEQVYANSGRLPPSAMAALDKDKINSIAQARADAQIGAYPRADQVDIGGGKFINRTDVDRVASRRMQPVIDDMHEKAQLEAERKAKLCQEQEERKAEAAMIKARGKEMKETYRQLKKDEKARKAEEKAAAKRAKRDSKMAGKVKDEQLTNGKDETEEADVDMMTAPDTSVASTSGAEASSPDITTSKALETKDEPPRVPDESSPVSPAVPVAVLAVPMVLPVSTEATVASPVSPVSPVPPATPAVAATGPGSTPEMSEKPGMPEKPTTPAVASTPAADDRNETSTETPGGNSAGRRLSKLFVKTPKENTDRKRSESNGSYASKIPSSTAIAAAGTVGAASAIGATTASQSKSSISDINGPHSTASATAAKPTTPKSPLSPMSPMSPMSPLSDNESSSPNSNKVRSWFKSRFTRDRSKSSASATGAPLATSSDKAASTGASSGTAAPLGAAASGPSSKALGTTAVSDNRSTTEKSFVGGHALTGAESPTPQGRSSGPAIGSGGLSMPLVAGGAIAAAGGATAAAGLSSSKDEDKNKDTTITSTGQNAGGQRDSTASASQQYYTPTDSQRQSGADQPTSPTARAGETIALNSSEQAPIPEAAGATGITAARDSTEKDAAAMAQAQESPSSLGYTSGAHGSAATSFGMGPLTPVTRGPVETSSASGTAAGATDSASSAFKSAGAGAAGAAGLVGAAGLHSVIGSTDATAATGDAPTAAGFSSATGVASKEGPNYNHTLPGNRTSYASSHYSADAGVPGVAGSGFGLVGANIFANISSTVPLEKADNGTTFVSVPPPTSTTTPGVSAADTGAAFTPPKAIRDPAQKKSASPVRDSRFLENLEELS